MKKWWIYCLGIVFLCNFVLGLDPLGSFQSYSPVDIYYEYSYWIDFIVSFLIFLGVSSTIFGKKFEGSGKMVSFGMSFVLAMSLVWWEMRNGINLMTFGPSALAILFFLIGLLFYFLVRKMGKGKLVGVSVAYVVSYIVLIKVFDFGLPPELETLYVFLSVMFAVAVGVALIGWFIDR